MDFEKFDEKLVVPAEQPPQWRWRIVALVALLSAGAGGLAYHWSREREAVLAARERERLALAALIEIEAEARGPGASLAARVQVLEKLLAAQREVAEVRPSEMAARSAAITRTEVELRRLRSEADRLRSEGLEQEAETAMKEKRFEAAVPLWREALELRQAVLRATGEAGLGGDRVLRIEQELLRAQAEPRVAQVAMAMSAAAAASETGDWTLASDRYREAREMQERLNRDFPRSRFSDLTVLARIDAEIAALSADGLEARVVERREAARRLAVAGRTDEAIRAHEQAAEAQLKLNERFAGSRFVSMERLEEIEVDLQSLRAATGFARLEALGGIIQGHLRARRIFQAQLGLQDAAAVSKELAARYPRARGGDEPLRLALLFLSQKSNELAALQDRIYGLAAPLPGNPALALARQPVTQEDFVRVMSANPSRTAGRTLPVESVTPAEAEEFCRRLSWVMGHRVRLPERGELEAARGEPGMFTELDAGRTEWLAGGAGESGGAPVWAAGQVGEAPRNERAAGRGFRFVVEVNLAEAP